MDTLRYWSKGIRFYIAVGAVLVTVLVIAWARTAYGGSSLAAIRTEEIFAWLATGLLAVAVSIGPVYKLFPQLTGKRLWFEARRLIGISAAWFASLHVGIAYAALFKAANPLSLARNYQLAFLLGLIGLVGLLAMAFTSFDKAFSAMGIWWFRLHRVVYLVIVLSLFHIFMIGVHAALLPVLVLLATVCLLLVGAYAAISLKARAISFWQIVGIASMTVLLGLAMTYGFTQRHNQIVHGAANIQAGSQP